jgi:spore coat polysaccharide biosynthesis predicted glycosyltransferase SpsG
VTPEPLLLVRTDAGPGIGAGHFFRCLALVEEWRRRGGRALYATATGYGPLERRLEAEGVGIFRLDAEPGSNDDAEETAELAEDAGAAWIAVDGSRFDGNYQTRLGEAEARLLWIDDRGHAPPYTADLVLNPNPHAGPEHYAPRSPSTRLLLGARHVLLRRELRREPEEHPGEEVEVPATARRILVTLGADPEGATGTVLEALAGLGLPGLEVTVMADGSDPRLEELRRTADALPGAELHVDVDDVAPFLAVTDLAVVTAGGTIWELLHRGVPVLLLTLAPHQEPIAREVHRRGAGVDLGRFSDLTVPQITRAVAELVRAPRHRAHLAQRGRGLVDGRGAERVVDAMVG